jgi:hypothetical protein
MPASAASTQIGSLTVGRIAGNYGAFASGMGALIPSVNDALNIGTTTLAWARIYLTDDATGTIYQLAIINGVLTISPVGG